MNTPHLFSTIKPPFFVDTINNMVLDGEVESFFSDFQEALKLTDAQADARDQETSLTNFECLNSRGQRVVYSIAQDAVISCDEHGEFGTTDIFGNAVNFTIHQVDKVLTLADVLAHQADPKNFTPAHQIVLNWLEEHKALINQFVDVSFYITDEYRPSADDDYLLFRGDLQVDFVIQGRKFDIVSPAFLSLKEADGALVLNCEPIDITRDDWECFQSILTDVEDTECDAVATQVDNTFSLYFNIAKVPNWQERLLNSFKHDDVLEILKQAKQG